MKLILFEDTDEQAQSLLAALKQQLRTEGTVERFVPPNENDLRIYEERLADDLATPRYADASLIVADRDLSKTPSYRGLSESAVRRAADSLATPECSYARRAEEHGFLVAAEQRESCIAVSITQGEENCARQVVAIAQGFRAIQEKLRVELRVSGKKSPGKTLAAVLGKPEYAEKIALYASGDQNRLAAVLRMRGTNEEEKLKRLSCLLGNWLWDSVLRYPGVVVNAIAASSYLNIRAKEFVEDAKLRSVFESALYTGPFSHARDELWWRGMLDDLVAGKSCADGRSFASEILGNEIPRSECCENSAIPAGYYCMLSNKPVSLTNSKGGLPWFPRGADLARVSIKQYEELSPWL